MLMLYQAALRSDRATLPRQPIIIVQHEPCNRPGPATPRLGLISARGACRAMLGFPRVRGARPPEPLVGRVGWERAGPASQPPDRAGTGSAAPRSRWAPRILPATRPR